MKVICCIDDRDQTRDYKLIDSGIGYTFKWYYDWTMPSDKWVIVKHYKYYAVDNSKMYDDRCCFKDEWNPKEHPPFKTYEEALMYAVSCV